MGINCILSFLLALGSTTFVEPAYPPNAVSGGTVVASLSISSGNVAKVTVHSGEEPFIRSAESALAQWHLPSETKDPQLVIVHFRQPNLYYLADPGETISSPRPVRSMPFPQKIVGPGFPAQAMGPGSVMLRTEIQADGGIGIIEVLKSEGSFTAASREALRQWKFLPAENDRGIAIASRVYVVFVYRLPVIEQKR
jgi:TonB family protein